MSFVHFKSAVVIMHQGHPFNHHHSDQSSQPVAFVCQLKLVINGCLSFSAQDATCHLIIMSFAESSFHTAIDVTQLLVYCNVILGPVSKLGETTIYL